MTQAAATESEVAPLRSGRSLWADASRRIRRDPIAMICLGAILLYALIAVLAPFVLSNWASNVDFDNTNQGPSWSHPLGTDAFGRDVLQKTLLGAHVSMTVAFGANIVAIPLGMLLGAIAGYYGGILDDVIVWLYTTLAAVPGVVRLIAIRFAFQGQSLFENTRFEMNLDGMWGLIIALGVMSWIGTCRLVRAETMKLRELDYVIASRAAGRNSFSTLLRHVMPNIMHIGIINFSLGFFGAIVAEVSLSFLGLGIPDKPSWGKMIDTAKFDLIVGRWWEVTAATVAMFIIILAWNIFGDRLRDALDPKLRNL